MVGGRRGNHGRHRRPPLKRLRRRRSWGLPSYGQSERRCEVLIGGLGIIYPGSRQLFHHRIKLLIKDFGHPVETELGLLGLLLGGHGEHKRL